MIELPEAVTIANQLTARIKGKRIKAANRGNITHKFAFYSREPEEYETQMPGMMVGETTAHGCAVVIRLEPDHVLVLGDGGERILLHEDASTLPAKRHFMIEFTDGSFLSVAIQCWGAAMLLHDSETPGHYFIGDASRSPIGERFTPEIFVALFDNLAPDDKLFVKQFIISKPGVPGVGNGFLQDVLFAAGIHPRRRAVDLSGEERVALYNAIRDTIGKAIELGGRDTEHDTYNRVGGYVKLMDRRTAGKPCPKCGTIIEKMSFLGGTCYFCPTCQK